MSRKLFIAGNWKMNLDRSRSLELSQGLVGLIGKVTDVDLAVAPPFVYLRDVVEAMAGSEIGVGAQNMWYEDNGAYTGEISAAMLQDVGCRYVILGHSERRHVIGETDEIINRKVLQALGAGLDVILCVGELLEERKAEKTMEVVERQVRCGLEGVSRMQAEDVTVDRRVTIAYEPVWAIGTGETATPDQAQEVHAAIRKLLAELYDDEVASKMRIQYGGSVKPGNAAELLGRADVDGALVGGASLKPQDFAGIVKAATE
jgi:triosephosphate isomerase